MHHTTKRFSVARWEHLKLSKEDKVEYTLIANLLVDDKDPLKKIYQSGYEKIMHGIKKYKDKFKTFTTPEFKLFILGYPLDEIKIIFLVFTDINVGKDFDPETIIQEFKVEFIKLHTDSELIHAKENGKVNKKSQHLLNRLAEKYAEGKVALCSMKVDAISDVLEDSVNTALGNVENLNELEKEASKLEEEASNFKKGAVEVQHASYRNYILQQLFFAFLCVLFIGIMILAVCVGTVLC